MKNNNFIIVLKKKTIKTAKRYLSAITAASLLLSGAAMPAVGAAPMQPAEQTLSASSDAQPTVVWSASDASNTAWSLSASDRINGYSSVSNGAVTTTMVSDSTTNAYEADAEVKAAFDSSTYHGSAPALKDNIMGMIATAGSANNYLFRAGTAYTLHYTLSGSWSEASASSPNGAYLNVSTWTDSKTRKDNLTNNNITSTSEGVPITKTYEFTPSANCYAQFNFELRRVNAGDTMTVSDIYVTTEEELYSVTFVSNGGTAVASQQVSGGSAAEEPAAPIRDGCTFGGWYTDEALTDVYDFSSAVTGNLTLYAKWTSNTGDTLVEEKIDLSGSDVKIYRFPLNYSTKKYEFDADVTADAVYNALTDGVYTADTNIPANNYVMIDLGREYSISTIKAYQNDIKTEGTGGNFVTVLPDCTGTSSAFVKADLLQLIRTNKDYSALTTENGTNCFTYSLLTSERHNMGKHQYIILHNGGNYKLNLAEIEVYEDKTEKGEYLSVRNFYNSHMVLQRGKPHVIKGYSSKGTSVTVTMTEDGDPSNTQTVSATPDSSGSWTAELTAMTPGISHTYTITITDDKGGSRTLTDVLVGDVFLASGQSNMAYDGPKTATEADNVNEPGNAGYYRKGIYEKQRSLADPNIRMFKIRDDSKAESAFVTENVPVWIDWCRSDGMMPETKSDLSTTSVEHENILALSTLMSFFADERIKAEPDIPVGVIQSSRGGSPIEIWSVGGRLYNNHIAPLEGLNVAGILWYQGCGNSNETGFKTYKDRFEALIKDYRRVLGNDQTTPFMFVQLAPFKNSNPEYVQAGSQRFQVMREIQRSMLDDSEVNTNLYMAVSMDTTENSHHDNDGNVVRKSLIHPLGKDTLAKRMAAAYKEMKTPAGAVVNGPLVSGAAASGRTVTVSFKSGTADGLKVLNPDYTYQHEGQVGWRSDTTELEEFKLAGSDGVYYNATAKIVGDTVEVTSAYVSEPKYVSYAYSEIPKNPNLANGAELPASPFNISVDGSAAPVAAAETEEVTTFEVTLKSNGGSGVEPQTVVSGKTAKKPSDPAKEGYTFGGWYRDEALTSAYNFNSQVTDNITLYAKWTNGDDVAEEQKPSDDSIPRGVEEAIADINIPRDKAMQFNDGDKVAMIGDSITNMDFYSSFLIELYAAKKPDARIDFYNMGIGGNTALMGLQMLDKEFYEVEKCAGAVPNKAVIMYGMNDSSLLTGQTDEENIEEYKKNMTDLVAAVKAKGVEDITIMSSSPYDDTMQSDVEIIPAKQGARGRLMAYAEWLESFCKENGCHFIDLTRTLYPLLDAYQASDRTRTFINPDDRVHPKELGGLVMMYVIAKAQGLDGIITEKEVEASGSRAEFDYTLSRNNIAPTNGYFEANRIVPLTRDFNQEILRVKGLDSGLYDIDMAGFKAGPYTAEELETGINMAVIPDSPMARRSAMLNGAMFSAHRVMVNHIRNIRTAEKKAMQNGIDPMDDAAVLAYVGSASDDELKPQFKNAYLNYKSTEKALYDSYKGYIDMLYDAAAETDTIKMTVSAHEAKNDTTVFYDGFTDGIGRWKQMMIGSSDRNDYGSTGCDYTAGSELTDGSGAGSAKIEIGINKARDYFTIADYIAVMPDTEYQISASVKTEDVRGTDTVSMSVIFYDAENNKLGSDIIISDDTKGTHSWQRIGQSMTSPSGAAYMRIDLSGRCLTDGAAEKQGTIWFDDVRLTQELKNADFEAAENGSVLYWTTEDIPESIPENYSADMMTFASVADWKVGTGGSAVTASYDKDVNVTGGRSVKFVSTASGTSADRYYLYPAADKYIKLLPDTYYKITLKAKTEDYMLLDEFSQNKLAGLTYQALVYPEKDGAADTTAAMQQAFNIPGSTSEAATSDWSDYYMVLHTPAEAGAYYLRSNIMMRFASGTAWADSVRVEMCDEDGATYSKENADTAAKVYGEQSIAVRGEYRSEPFAVFGGGRYIIGAYAKCDSSADARIAVDVYSSQGVKLSETVIDGIGDSFGYVSKEITMPGGAVYAIMRLCSDGGVMNVDAADVSRYTAERDLAYTIRELEPEPTDEPPAEKTPCVKITAEYNEDGTLKSVGLEDGFAEETGEPVLSGMKKVFIWDSIYSMIPIK